jgi:hypothetical protein
MMIAPLAMLITVRELLDPAGRGERGVAALTDSHTRVLRTFDA